MENHTIVILLCSFFFFFVILCPIFSTNFQASYIGVTSQFAPFKFRFGVWSALHFFYAIV